MKTRLFSATVMAVVLGSFLASGAWAADLTHNLGETLNLGTGAVSYDNVLVGSGGGNASTIVDATGTESFTSEGTQFYVGAGSANVTHRGTLNLGILNTITADQVTIGGLQPDGNLAGGHVGSVTTLADSVTTIHAANMALGTGKGTGTFTLGSDATLNLYGLTGSESRAELVMGRMDGFNARGNYGTMNLSGGTANLWLSELHLGRVTVHQGSGAQPVDGKMTLGTSASNVLNVEGAGSVIRIGSTTQNNQASGTLTINNLADTSVVKSTDNSTAILIAHRSGSAASTGTFNFNGGTLKVTTTGAAIAGDGGTSTLNLSGGAKLVAGDSSSNWIHSLTTATIGTGGATIDTDGNNVGVSQAFSGAGGLTKAGEGTLTLSGANTYTGATTVSGGRLQVEGELGAGAVNVESGAALGGSGTINGDVTFASGAIFYYDSLIDTGLTIAAGKTVTFGGLGISNLAGLDWDSMDLNTPYTLIYGDINAGSVISNWGETEALAVGSSNRSAYFQEGSLQLVVIPEPATSGLLVLGAAAGLGLLRRKLHG